MGSHPEYAALEAALLRAVAAGPAADPVVESASPSGALAELEAVFEAQLTSRHLDALARDLQARGEGFYTIGSSGHEANAAVALALRPTDPALLHYRSGGFFCARARQAGDVDPVAAVVHSLTSSTDDPISGGRHKVFGHPRLAIIPTTSTIASHLPRAVGLAFALDLGRQLGVRRSWPDDAIVVASLGDASINHSTALGALNTVGHATHRGLPLPLLVVVEDNGLGISVPSPPGWVARQLGSHPGVGYVAVDGFDPLATLAVARDAAEEVRRTRRPMVLHLRTVRLGGHAGSDTELAYRTPAALAADRARDPLLGTALALRAHGWSVDQVVARYRVVEDDVRRTSEALLPVRRLDSAATVTAPLWQRGRRGRPATSASVDRAAAFGAALPEHAGPLTLAQSLNAALVDLLAAHPQAIAFGEDVAVKGGVYGVTRGLRAAFGPRRVFDTLLDEQTVLGLAAGSALAGFLPVPEIQYLAYLHNAEDQLRGEAATMAFFSNGQFGNGMLVRVAGLAYQKGFGGHFHNDNSVAVLRDVPGLVLACPSSAAEAPGLVRSLAAMALAEQRVCVLLEPIALYHTRERPAPYPPPDAWVDPALGSVGLQGEGADVLVVTFGNGVGMSLDAVAESGVAATVLDLRWLAPLPMAEVLAHARRFPRVLVVDETRRSGGVSEGVVAGLVDGGYAGRIDRVTSHDSVIPLGPAADAVLLGRPDILRALRE